MGCRTINREKFIYCSKNGVFSLKIFYNVLVLYMLWPEAEGQEIIITCAHRRDHLFIVRTQFSTRVGVDSIILVQSYFFQLANLN